MGNYRQLFNFATMSLIVFVLTTKSGTCISQYNIDVIVSVLIDCLKVFFHKFSNSITIRKRGLMAHYGVKLNDQIVELCTCKSIFVTSYQFSFINRFYYQIRIPISAPYDPLISFLTHFNNQPLNCSYFFGLIRLKIAHIDLN